MDSKIFFGLFLVVILIPACATENVVVEEKQETSKPAEQQATIQKAPPKQNIPAEIKELFDKSKTRVSNVYYKYRGPETGANFHEFYIKGSKIKYKPYLETKSLDEQDSYDSIFIDKCELPRVSLCAQLGASVALSCVT